MSGKQQIFRNFLHLIHKHIIHQYACHLKGTNLNIKDKLDL